MKDDRTNEIKHDLIPDGTATIIVKYKGKVYSKGMALGDLNDEKQLRTTLMNLDALVYIFQRTVFYTFAEQPKNKMFDLEAPNDSWIIDRPRQEFEDETGQDQS
jgi:hypothetical protein